MSQKNEVQYCIMRSTHDLISKDFVLGVDINSKSVHCVDNELVLYIVGCHVILFNRFDRKQKFVFQCHGTEIIQAIAVCPMKLSLAIAIICDEGAVVLIFDINTRKRKTIKLSPEFGMVIKLSLSADSTLLILGGEPHYHMELWHLKKNPMLQASIKLATPSGKRIRDASICPMESTLICVIGNCNLRFFRIIDSIFRPITVTLGREQQNYNHHCWISKDQVVLGTDNEIIVLINFTVKYCIKVNDWGQNIASMTSLSRGILVGGEKGSIRVYQMKSNNSNLLEIFKEEDISKEEALVQIKAIDCFEAGNYGICLTSEGRIRSFELSSFETLEPVNHKFGKDIIPYFHTYQSQDFESRSAEILSISVCPWKPIVATAGSDRSIIISNYKDATIQLRQYFPDEISSIALHPCATMILICFHTCVQLCSIHKCGLSDLWKKESEEKQGLCAFSHGGGQFVYCTGPYAHVFDTYSLSFVASLRGHSKPITSLCWRKGVCQLATIGEDGVICTWNSNTGKRLKRVSNENFNFISGYMTDDWNQAYVNTPTNCKVYDFKTGAMNVFKEDLAVHGLGTKALIADSKSPGAADGEIIVVNLDSQNEQIMGLYLHSKNLTCAKLSPDNEYLFTASSDGSLCISKFHDILVPIRQYKYNEIPGPILLRDIFVQKSDIDNMNIRIEQLINELNVMKEKHEHQFSEIITSHKHALAKMKNDIAYTKDTYIERVDVEKLDLLNLQRTNEEKLNNHLQHLISSVKKSRAAFNKRLEEEKTKFDTLASLNDEKMKTLEEEYSDLMVKHASLVQSARTEYTSMIQDAKHSYQAMMTEKEILLARHEKMMKSIEEDMERQLSNSLEEYQLRSFQETRALTLLREEYDILKKRYDGFYADFEEQHDALSTLRDIERNLIRAMDELKMETNRIRSCVEKKIQDNREKESCIEELKKKSLHQERIHTVNSNRLHRLKIEHSKKDSMLQSLLHQSHTIEEELKSLMLKKDDLEVMKLNHLSKLKAIKIECRHKDQATSLMEQNIIAIKMRMKTIQELRTKDDMKANTTEITQHLKTLLNTCISYGNEKEETKVNPKKRQSDVENLKKKIRTIKENHSRGLKRHEENMKRLENEGYILSNQLHEQLSRLSMKDQEQRKWNLDF